MKKPKTRFHEVAEPTRRPRFEAESPQFLWASIPGPGVDREYDRRNLPELQYLRATIADRHKFSKDRQDQRVTGLGLEAFWSALKSAYELLILDYHFDIPAIITLRDHVRGVKNLHHIRIITGERGILNVLSEIKDDRRKSFSGEGELMVEAIDFMSNEQYPFPHDRFASVDGELWHFGGTVGCLENCLTAATRGWSAKEKGFLDFFDHVWKELRSPGKKS